ncbi:hypothetical protein OPV22_027772 [Ensete ventricosum]|uniref:Uncharacterized protein n=1 Tax=Ensete ventricosum TaxID=4639 RepID=A0AAV8Q0T7_ENSVE|nr:hypothetical protein OPV22_027772 [Ensete ventricosum]
MWCCYVGKATRIFFFVVAVLLVVGLVLGCGFFRHGSRGGNTRGSCGSDACRPARPQPVPAATTTSAPPLLSPPGSVSVAQAPFLA